MVDGGVVQGLPLFMLAVLVLNATPGVDLLLTVSRTAQGGARAGVGAALGICCGAVLHLLAGAFGLAALLTLSANAFWVIKWAGAIYLAWLGLGLLFDRQRRRPRPASRAPALPGTAPVHSIAPDFRRGLLTNLLNPKVALFLLAFLPQFVAPAATHQTVAFLALGAVFVLQSLLFLLATVALTKRLARLRILQDGAHWLKRVAGVLFLGLAFRLVSADIEGH